MARTPSAIDSSAALAGAACVLALTSVGSQVLAANRTPVAASPAHPAQALLTPVFGPDRVRTSIHAESAGRNFLVLIDERSATPDALARIEPILAAGAGYTANADTLEIQTLRFATGGLASLSLLAGLGIIAGGLSALLAGLLAFGVGRRSLEVEPNPSMNNAPPRPAIDLELIETERPAPALDRALRVAAADPARTAALLKTWMRPGRKTS
ncbi:MAG: hypothetical protein AAFQ67_00895 [Pseudomonadota bacterium]